MDLHAWIAQQVDLVEASAHARLKGLRVAFNPHDDGPVITGTVTEAARTAEGLQLDVSQYGAEPMAGTWANVPQVAAALRRCEADRRILARHNLCPDRASDRLVATSCMGCGVMGDCDDPVTENLSDCPELLDLAHAHGITPEILAGLDRPQPPEPKPRKATKPWGTPVLTGPQLLGMQAYTPMRDVPEALRGPRWNP